MSSYSQAYLKQLVDLLKWLDARLDVAVTTAQTMFEAETENIAYRGIQINAQEVARLLSQEPGQPTLAWPSVTDIVSLTDETLQNSPLGWLQKTFKLDNFDLGVLAIALAPELDRRYERIYVYLQDNVRGQRPTVDLSLNLLCMSALEKLERRANFSSCSPLIQQNLIHLIPDPHQTEPTLLAHIIKLDSAVIRLLLGERGLEPRLNICCQLDDSTDLRGDELILDQDRIRALLTFIQGKKQIGQKTILYFYGVERSLKKNTANAIAKKLKMPLLKVNLANIETDKPADFTAIIKLIIREAILKNTVLYIEDIDSFQAEDRNVFNQILFDQLSDYSGIIILAGFETFYTVHSALHGIFNVNFTIPNFEQRCVYWRYYLDTEKITIDENDLISLSDRFQLTSEQIAYATKIAVDLSQWKTSPRHQSQSIVDPTDSFFSAARYVSGYTLKKLSQQIQPKYTWSDIVLSSHQITQLREICDHVKYHHLVWETWQFDEKISIGKGLNVMFSGSSGTGKTMAAEVIANELKLDLYKIDLSQMVSKYIGETEKNLNQIFTSAMNANAILLFDEADALFGKRSAVKDAHDRYANLEVSYLLQKIEEYEGLSILTTNLRGNMDEAFMRRLQFIIEFQLPNEKQRYLIWQKVFPDHAPKDDDLGFDFLANNFELTGANIRNIALMAAFFAAAEHSKIERFHIIQALRREHQKMGKILKERIEDGYLIR